jgi:hypothetical protein
MKRSLPCFPARLVGLVITVLVVAAGCGGEKKLAAINGTVKYKGQPVRAGSVKFLGPNNSASVASIKPDGTFIITDVTPGEVKVAIVEGPPPWQDGKEPAPKVEPLPDKYGDPEKSGLKYTITPSTTTLDIDIK